MSRSDVSIIPAISSGRQYKIYAALFYRGLRHTSRAGTAVMSDGDPALF